CDDPLLGPLLRDRLLKSSPLGRHKVDLVTDTTPEERRRLAGMVRESRIDGFLWVDQGAISTGHVAFETRAQPDFLEKEFLKGALNAEITRTRLAHHGLKFADIDAALGDVDLEPVALGAEPRGTSSGDNGTAAFFVTLMSITLLEMSL